MFIFKRRAHCHYEGSPLAGGAKGLAGLTIQGHSPETPPSTLSSAHGAGAVVGSLPDIPALNHSWRRWGWLECRSLYCLDNENPGSSKGVSRNPCVPALATLRHPVLPEASPPMVKQRPGPPLTHQSSSWWRGDTVCRHCLQGTHA